MITVLSHIYNEMVILPFFIEEYRKRFPSSKFVFYDHMSTDGTTEYLSTLNNVTQIKFDTGGKIVNSKYLNIKNNAWKSFDQDWVCVCDADEILDITEQQLIDEEKAGTTIIRSKGYNMVNLLPTYDIDSLRKINHGGEFEPYSKYYMFNKRNLFAINYAPGCHSAEPIGKVQLSKNIYNAYHYRYLSLDLMNEKNKEYSLRVSEENKRNGLSGHYMRNAQQNKEDWDLWESKAVKLFEV